MLVILGTVEEVCGKLQPDLTGHKCSGLFRKITVASGENQCMQLAFISILTYEYVPSLSSSFFYFTFMRYDH